MAGHSHWAKVKRYKGVADARRGKLFSKLSKEITVAARMGGGDPNFNPRLRQAIQTARNESMPVDNIERAVKKGTGEIEGAQYEEIIYEGYGPGGVAVVVETATDNKNRTAADIRSLFTKNAGNLGGAGAVAWMFHRHGLITVNKKVTTEDALMSIVLDAGATDITETDDGFEIITPPEKLDTVQEALKKAGIVAESAKLTFIPANQVPVTDLATAEQVVRLYEALDDHDDVQNVYANFDIASELLNKIG